MTLKKFREFIGNHPDNYELGVSGDFEPDADLWLVVLNDKLQPVSSMSFCSKGGGTVAASQLNEMDVNPPPDEDED